MDPAVEEEPKSHALYVHELYAVNTEGWAVLYSFFYDGESYDYGFGIGDPRMTERQARDQCVRLGIPHRARQAFMRDVEIPEPQDVELR